MQATNPNPASADAGTHASHRISPHVPAAPHSGQRYFTRGDPHSRSLELDEGKRATATDQHSSCEVRVYRSATEDRIQLTTSVNCNFNQATVTALLTAPELRDLSARLLDAAHDLEVNPASTLVALAA